MTTFIDISILLSYLRSTSNLALSCVGFHRLVISNGFPIRTSEGDLCLENYPFYKLLEYPNLDEWERRRIFEVIKGDNPGYLQLLLQKGLNIEAKNKDIQESGETGLMLAAYLGKTECLCVLLEHRADVEARDSYENTALIYAACCNTTDCLQLLLKSGANREVKNGGGKTALMWAAWNGSVDCLQLLLGHRASVEVKDNDENTALILAARYGKTDCLQLLLEHKADIEAENNDGKTAMFCAARLRRIDCIKVLAQRGAIVSPEVRARYPQYALWGDSTL